MSKKMEVVVSDEDYDWMNEFVASTSPEDGYDFDAPSVFADLIERANFTDVKDERVESWHMLKKNDVYGWSNGKEFRPQEFTVQQQEIIKAMINDELEAQYE